MLKKILLILPILIISFVSISAQDDLGLPAISYSGTPKTYEIAAIEVVGITNYDPQILANISGLRVGQELLVPGSRITEAINKYWRHGLFSNVKIVATKIEGRKIYLEISLTERPRLADMNFFGLKKGEIEDVTEKIAMMKGTQVTPHLVSRAEKYITSYFVDKGFSNVEVQIVQRDDAEHENNVILDITVDKKEKVKVNSLVFKGNTIFSDNKLNRTMKKTNEKGKIRNFFRTKKYNEEKYKEDLIAVIDKYNEFGYRDSRIVKETVTKNDDNTVDVKVEIEEGRKYYIGDISWVGNSIYPAEFLSAQLRIKKGDIFNQKHLEERLSQDEDAVSNWYMDNGYLFSSITPVEVTILGDTIDLEMRVYEGKQASINNVIIKGNTKTHEHVVRREIRTKPGELFSKSELIRTVRELSQLGHFDPEKISPDVSPNQEDGSVDLVYNLEERANDQIELSGGWGAGMFVGSLGLKFTNFSVRNIPNKKAWRPLPTGDGQTLSLRMQTNGAYYQNYSVSFVEPWLGGKKPNSLSVSLYHSVQSGVSSNYASNYNSYYNSYNSYYQNADDIDQYMKITGASVGFGKRLSWPDDYFGLYLQAGLQHYSMENWNYFGFATGVSDNLSFAINFSRKSTDSPLYTRSGSDFSVGLELTPPYSLFSDKDYEKINADYENGNENAAKELYRWIEYHKWSFKGSLFKPMDNATKLVLMTKFEMGFLGYYDKNRRSPFEKYVVGGDGMSGFSMGGSETIGLRGYENSSLTPRSTRGSYNGNMYNKFTMEMRYPFSLSSSAVIYGLGFLEAGAAWDDFENYNPFELKRSAGAGVRIFLPMFGLMGIDWGYGFDESIASPGSPSGGKFHFVIGQSF